MTSNPMAIRTRAAIAPATLAHCWTACVLLLLAGAVPAAQFTINGPAGSAEFGRTVTILPNGNIVVTDPGFDAPGPVVDAGAVFLYRPNGTLVSTLRGGTANDRVGSGGVVVLANGNYVVGSPDWDNGAASNAGAATFGLGTSGVAGVVSPANSLVGSTANDRVGSAGVTVLGNGNYVVRSPLWNNGAIVDAGAVTFGSGTSGVSGVVSPTNSLVGGTAADAVGGFGVTALGNGNYVVGNPEWDNGAIADVGAVTFGSGTSGISGAVSPANSLVGSIAGDRVGASGIVALGNGNYVVRSPSWDNSAIVDAGAVTFGSGTSGISGAVSPVNSLVGSAVGDQVGVSGVIALANGNYVVASRLWDNGPAVDAGAVTFGSGTNGVTGVVSAANSLVGSTASDLVGGAAVTALSNGNYVVRSPIWNNGTIVDAGAVTFGSGTSGISGAISPANSLVGETPFHGVGNAVVALTDGNYVVTSPNWGVGATASVGAVTFGSGTSGISGPVTPANSLIGSTTSDMVGNSGVIALANGNYVVRSTSWDDGAIVDAGAVTFCSGTSCIGAVVSSGNSLVGSTAGDRVGSSGVTTLGNGNYVVRSQLWDNGATVDAGAATFGSGTSGISGAVTPANSLVGSTANDLVGSSGATALGNGSYVVRSPSWDNGATVDVGAATFCPNTGCIGSVVSPTNSLIGGSANDSVGFFIVNALSNDHYVVNSPAWDNGAISNAGAITLGLSNGSVVGPITDTHSVLGVVASEGFSSTFGYDALRNQLAVGQPASNRVVLQRTGIATAISLIGDTPDPSGTGQPVAFTATVSASPAAPTNGQVTFTASSGENCVDTTPTPTSPTTAEFSCTITFNAPGSSTVVAEYTGSIIHAYSGSGLEPHTTILDPVFANGFESP